ncbi:Fe-S cluster assembly iron-binding protein IscA [Humidesulfovibrio mexicanus]|jgi:Fe-S cluster assembly iron-binding protein IscA|uniref:Fe-S cluster assembly iron-binding protein IscA n=1 Tax=Humidesulfovibrio mexicanus TaxID=147047 RepID=A0A238YY02_9BACT|nr:IscA/HesB family protein [Humidesulfovibrio mexicanus]SNR75995.1 Fe-S cluster assembly iron-binding protein IscA [Humidesulfovibrio mexicanus]
MITLSDAAKAQLDNYFADKEKSAVRIFVGGSCCGPKLSLALDEAREGDEVVETGGFTLLAEKSLLAVSGAISIDMTEYGFSVESEIPLEGGSCGSGSCGSSGCGSGGCGC